MNFIATQKLLISILNFFGFFSFKFTKDGISNYHIYRVIFIFIVTNLFYQILSLYVQFNFAQTVQGYLQDDTAVTKMVMILQGSVREFCAIVIFYSSLTSRGTQIKFFEQLIAIEMKVNLLKSSALNVKVFNQKMRSKCLVYCLTTIGLYIMMLILTINLIPNEGYSSYLYISISFILVTIYAALIAIFMDNILTSMGFYFEEINKNIQKFAEPGSVLFRFHEFEIRDLFQLHNELIQVIELFNDAFGMIFVGIFVFTFGMLSCELYFSYTTFAYSIDTVELGTAINVITNVISYIPLFMVISKVGFTCESVQEKVSFIMDQNSFL